MSTITLTRKELEDFAVNALGLARMDLARMSTQFLAQLLQLKVTGDARALDMVEEISHLEKVHRGLEVWPAGSRLAIEDWIVFRRFNGTNYYLTLARLNEGDRDINQRVRQACEFDFPFLRELQPTPQERIQG
jgi:hypothetical protein